MQEKDLFQWLKLGRCKGIKRETIKTTVDLFVDAEKVIEELGRRSSLLEGRGKIIFPSDDDVKRELDSIISSGAELISIKNPHYPSSMRDMFQAPIVLTVKGNKNLLNGRNFGVVGSRVPCINSIKFAGKIVLDLLKSGLNIVSGLANGIDTVAHKVALSGKEPNNSTIAVLGTGISKIYPPENKNLLAQIISEGGLVVSEFEFDSPPISHHFPQRNGTIAGLSAAILVIEAKRNSGSLVTAKYANSFNKEVYVVPGFPDDERFLGSNDLIKRNQAKIINSSEDILSDMLYMFDNSIKENKSSGFDFDSEEDFRFSKDEVKNIKNLIYSSLSTTPVQKTDILAIIPRSSREIEVALLELELEGVVARSFDGGFFKVSAEDADQQSQEASKSLDD